MCVCVANHVLFILFYKQINLRKKRKMNNNLKYQFVNLILFFYDKSYFPKNKSSFTYSYCVHCRTHCKHVNKQFFSLLLTSEKYIWVYINKNIILFLIKQSVQQSFITDSKYVILWHFIKNFIESNPNVKAKTN